MVALVDFGSADAVLVFFDWLARFNSSRDFEKLGTAERRVLWDLEATLEAIVAEAVSRDYKASVREARTRISYGGES
jgi:hypothetical protein